MMRKPPYRTDRGRKGVTPIPPACWGCWWKESGKCFNNELGAVPEHLHTYTNKQGKEVSYTLRDGFDITDEHWFKCRENLALKNENKKLEDAEGNDRRLILLLSESVA